MLEPILYVIAGLILLTLGGEWLVRGASRLALHLGMSPMVIGLTIVAFGTSAPEMIVSTNAALGGQADLAMGNIVGSNIFNVLFILGISAIFFPLMVHRLMIQREVPIMVAASVLTWVMARDGMIQRTEGCFLVLLLVAYTAFQVRRGSNDHTPPAVSHHTPLPLSLLMIVGGLVALVLGARSLIHGAVDIARTFGVSELIIGLTIVAAGTSLPEVATSVLATIRGERDIAIGNVIGSNIFNLLGVLGISAAVAPQGVPVSPAMLVLDLPIMLGVAILCWPIFWSGKMIVRWEGAAFIAGYVIYTGYLILQARPAIG